MIEVKQRTDSDCFAACVASILECEIDALPDVAPVYLPDMLRDGAWAEWAAEQNIEFFIHRHTIPRGFSIGVVHYSDVSGHAVVCLDGVPVWDSEDQGRIAYWIKLRGLHD